MFHTCHAIISALPEIFPWIGKPRRWRAELGTRQKPSVVRMAAPRIPLRYGTGHQGWPGAVLRFRYATEILAPAPRIPLRYGTGHQGWPGAVPRFRYATEILAPAPGIPLRYGTGHRGWHAVPRFRYATDILAAPGCRPKLSSTPGGLATPRICSS